MAAKAKMLEDLFHETLKDIYFAKKQILKALRWLSRPTPTGCETPLRRIMVKPKDRWAAWRI
jgi:hypothetical protein